MSAYEITNTYENILLHEKISYVVFGYISILIGRISSVSLILSIYQKNRLV